MDKLYVVGKIGYEYNDEIYYKGGSGGIEPVTVYTSKERATAEAQKANLEQFLKEDFMAYCYDVEDIFNDINSAQKLLEKYGYEERLSELAYEGDEVMSIIKQMTQSDQLAFIETINLQFFDVREVKLEE